MGVVVKRRPSKVMVQMAIPLVLMVAPQESEEGAVKVLTRSLNALRKVVGRAILEQNICKLECCQFR
jgi:hypothetical protein